MLDYLTVWAQGSTSIRVFVFFPPLAYLFVLWRLLPFCTLSFYPASTHTSISFCFCISPSFFLFNLFNFPVQSLFPFHVVRLIPVSCSLSVFLGDSVLIRPCVFSCFLWLPLPPLSFPQLLPHPLSLRLSPSLPQAQLHPQRHVNIQLGEMLIKSENISLNLEFTPHSNISPPHPSSAGSGHCFIFTQLYTISPREQPTNNYLFCCWLTGAVEGLSALLKDMSNESEEWASLAFLPPWPFIILVLHSHLFICNHHLHTPSTHPHCPVAVVPPPSPPSLSLLWALPCSISLLSHHPLLLLLLQWALMNDQVWFGGRRWNRAREWERKSGE